MFSQLVVILIVGILSSAICFLSVF